MRYLILTDIHSNWDALKEVIEDARGRHDAVVCCGDVVGYGAEPNQVVEWVRENAQVAIRGNHDRACTGLEDLEWFNAVARAAAVWTQQALTQENLDWVRRLPQGPRKVEDFLLAHGSPLDEDQYIADPLDAGELRGYLLDPLCFFGHTHLQGAFQIHRNGVLRTAGVSLNESQRWVPLEPDSIFLVNPGSVGQPRDGDPRAAYALYDPGDKAVELRRVPYAVGSAQRKITEAGLPPLLAHRLSLGR